MFPARRCDALPVIRCKMSTKGPEQMYDSMSRVVPQVTFLTSESPIRICQNDSNAEPVGRKTGSQQLEACHRNPIDRFAEGTSRVRSRQKKRLYVVADDRIEAIGISAAGNRFCSSSPNSRFLLPVWSSPRPNRRYPRAKLSFRPQKSPRRAFVLLPPRF